MPSTVSISPNVLNSDSVILIQSRTEAATHFGYTRIFTGSTKEKTEPVEASDPFGETEENNVLYRVILIMMAVFRTHELSLLILGFVMTRFRMSVPGDFSTVQNWA
jgi:hypothetical protein